MSKAKNIERDLLYQLYIVENKGQKEIAEIIGCSQLTIGNYVKKYKIKKDLCLINELREKNSFEKFGTKTPLQNLNVIEKIKKTNLERHGCENVFQNEVVKEKIKRTNLEEYGCENVSQNELIKNKKQKTTLNHFGTNSPFESDFIQEKIRKSNLEKYGCENPQHNLEIRNKTKKTNLKKYGCENVFNNSEIKKRIQNTVFEKYGVTHISQSYIIQEKIKKNYFQKTGFSGPGSDPEVRRRMKETRIRKRNITLYAGKTAFEWARIYDIPVVTMYKWCQLNPEISEQQLKEYTVNYRNHLTNIESIIQQKLFYQKWNKKFHQKIRYQPDFKMSDTIALNVDGLYWHSELEKKSNYHFQMRRDYEELGLRIFQFRADEVFCKLNIIQSIISNAIGQTQIKIGARKTIVKLINAKEAKCFLEENHIKGYKSAKHLGLYHNDELVSLISYKSGRERKSIKSFIKIERFCSKVGLNVIGGFSKLLKFVKIKNGGVPIHYWVDLRYGTGNFLLNQGFKRVRETLGWEWTDFDKTYNRLKCRANMDQRKLSEKEYAIELGWVKIYDAGQRLYVG
jgi:predicted transcriptional regulator